MTLYKYSGAGNDFIILDGRRGGVDAYRAPGTIAALCDRGTGLSREGFRTGADGVIILKDSANADFAMEYYNPDGSGGMMCGNGGRCIVAFARHLGILPSEGDTYRFEAPDGMHVASVISGDGRRDTVRLGMKDVQGLEVLPDGLFLDTGTRHFVRFVPDVEEVDIEVEGPKVRWRQEFAPVGTNVNFVSREADGSLKIRTFEKGVEGETLACGTGITASAIAAFASGIAPARTLPAAAPFAPGAPAGGVPVQQPSSSGEGGSQGIAAEPFPGARRLLYELRARTDTLTVDFVPFHPAPLFRAPSDIPSFSVRSVFLTGPAELLYETITT